MQRGGGGCSSRLCPAGKWRGTGCPVDENVTWLPFVTAWSPGGGIAPRREAAGGLWAGPGLERLSVI